MSGDRTRLLQDLHRLSGRPAEGPVRRMIRDLSAGAGSDSTPARLREARAQAQVPVSTGRRIALVGASGGAGVSTVAVLLGQAIDHARGGGTCLVTAGDAGPLRWRNGRSGGQPRLSIFGEAPEELMAKVAEHSRRSPVTLVECGRSLEQVRAVQPHVVVVVARRTVRGRELARATREALDLAVPVITVVREVPASGLRRTRTGYRDGHERVDGARVGGAGLVVLPHDRHVAGEAGLRLELTAEPTLVAVEELAGQVVRKAVLG